MPFGWPFFLKWIENYIMILLRTSFALYIHYHEFKPTRRYNFHRKKYEWNRLSINHDESGYSINPTSNYMFEVNNRNTRTRCEICSKLTIKTPERRKWRRSGVFIVNFEHIFHLVLMFLMPTSKWMVKFESWFGWQLKILFWD